MKRIFVTLFMLCLCTGLFAQTNRGDQSVGFNVGYGFDSENATLGIDYRYNITDAVRLSPSFTYFVKADGLSACAIDVNAHYGAFIGCLWLLSIGGCRFGFLEISWCRRTE